MATQLQPGSRLARVTWIRKGFERAAEKSFWAPITSKSSDAVVTMNKEMSATQVRFQIRGHLAAAAIEGQANASGEGVDKKVFSDMVNVITRTFVVKSAEIMNAINAGDRQLAMHEDSRDDLSNQFMMWKDQAITDYASGIVSGSAATHTVSIGDSGVSFGYNDLVDLETLASSSVVKGSINASTTTFPSRAPLKPVAMADGQPRWLFVIDSETQGLLMKEAVTQGIFARGDVRGNDNRLIKHVLGDVGMLRVMMCQRFFGRNNKRLSNIGSSNSMASVSNTVVEIPGIRQFVGTVADGVITAESWSGDSDFLSLSRTDGKQVWSVCLLMGAGAIKFAEGLNPRYSMEKSNFEQESESALITYNGFGKWTLKEEIGGDYDEAKIAGVDHGVIRVLVRVR